MIAQARNGDIQRVTLSVNNWVAICALLVGQMAPIVGTGITLLVKQAAQEEHMRAIDERISRLEQTQDLLFERTRSKP